MSKPRVFDSQDVPFKSAPIRAEWILAGAPIARNHVLFVSEDRSAVTMLWECSAGVFRWIYDEEETIHILDGGMTLTYPNGETRAVAKGDVVYFAPGDTAVWTVESHVRKFAVFRRPMPKALGLVLAACQKAAALLSPAGVRTRPAAQGA
jgi:uncharacterized cupin superfamily protein